MEKEKKKGEEEEKPTFFFSSFVEDAGRSTIDAAIRERAGQHNNQPVGALQHRKSTRLGEEEEEEEKTSFCSSSPAMLQSLQQKPPGLLCMNLGRRRGAGV